MRAILVDSAFADFKKGEGFLGHATATRGSELQFAHPRGLRLDRAAPGPRKGWSLGHATANDDQIKTKCVFSHQEGDEVVRLGHSNLILRHENRIDALYFPLRTDAICYGTKTTHPFYIRQDAFLLSIVKWHFWSFFVLNNAKRTQGEEKDRERKKKEKTKLCYP